jgi:hypothetical protein
MNFVSDYLGWFMPKDLAGLSAEYSAHDGADAFDLSALLASLLPATSSSTVFDPSQGDSAIAPEDASALVVPASGGGVIEGWPELPSPPVEPTPPVIGGGVIEGWPELPPPPVEPTPPIIGGGVIEGWPELPSPPVEPTPPIIGGGVVEELPGLPQDPADPPPPIVGGGVVDELPGLPSTGPATLLTEVHGDSSVVYTTHLVTPSGAAWNSWSLSGAPGDAVVYAPPADIALANDLSDNTFVEPIHGNDDASVFDLSDLAVYYSDYML